MNLTIVTLSGVTFDSVLNLTYSIRLNAAGSYAGVSEPISMMAAISGWLSSKTLGLCTESVWRNVFIPSNGDTGLPAACMGVDSVTTLSHFSLFLSPHLSPLIWALICNTQVQLMLRPRASTNW
ncbi:hypothetical protein OGAPHI_005747 [Ogataea philodendri]|uniref:Uncharacterized protein n=1 Tax=Ogataea philodendri TaxID=1378263 RepID=A0A9P8T217_9ASCO|nr:uncharacterized protein OGAPHI_005747 [Ogataea philodendri]KAH3662495.1 hypothetical protein OGAPHI_005747 [Ogataea philodendri]